MKRFLILVGLAASTLVATGAAQAGNVNWSIGINLPPVATYVSNGPSYYPAPVVYGNHYRPARPVYVAPPHLWLPPLPRLPAPPWAGRHHQGHHAGHWDRGHRSDRGDRWDRGHRRDRDDRDDRRGRGNDGRHDGHRR